MVMNYLDRVFQDMMLVLKARMGDSWAPSNPDMNPCDFFLGVLPEEVGEQAPPCQPLGPQGGDHQGVKQPAGGHSGQGCLWDEGNVPEAVESFERKKERL